jgi:uncharacterized protein (DUF302 family)
MAVVKRSRYSFSETVARLSKAITEAGGTVFATIDQAEAALQAGLTLAPTTLIVFGNPRAGTPLMEAYPLAALDLPLKLLVWEREGVVSVAYAPASELGSRYGIAGKDALLAALDAGLAKLSGSVGSPA